jgi:hypothetical protein
LSLTIKHASNSSTDQGGGKRRRARVIKLHSDRIFPGWLSSPIKADQNASDQKRAAKRGTDEIEVMTGTVRQAPPHAGKQVEPFGDVSEDHDR